MIHRAYPENVGERKTLSFPARRVLFSNLPSFFARPTTLRANGPFLPTCPPLFLGNLPVLLVKIPILSPNRADFQSVARSNAQVRAYLFLFRVPADCLKTQSQSPTAVGWFESPEFNLATSQDLPLSIGVRPGGRGLRNLLTERSASTANDAAKPTKRPGRRWRMSKPLTFGESGQRPSRSAQYDFLTPRPPGRTLILLPL